MRLIFLFALFVGAVFYSWIAFFDLPFLTRTGRLGPGFFPRILGGGMVVLIAWSLIEEILARRKLATGDDDESGTGRAVATMIALGLMFLLAIEILGGIPGAVIFLAAALAVFNAGDHLRNALVAICVPLVIYILFSVLLNAEIPEGLVPMPF